MYLRQTRRKNKDGSVVEYLQLAHNHRDPVTHRSRAEILYNLGRTDAVDREGLRRLVRSINRFLGPEDELKGEAQFRGGDEMHFVEGRPAGAAWLLSGIWEQLAVGATLLGQAKRKRIADPAEMVGCVMAMVANRALNPLSKHATPAWLAGDVYVAGAPTETYDEQLYRAMDFLLSASDEIQRAVFFRCADLLNLEVDLLLYDTTSVYVEMEDDDTERAERQERWLAYDADEAARPTRPRPQVVNDPPLRLRGHSRDRRGDLAQVVVGLAVTRKGIPVRCWVWPGNTSDAATVAEVKRSLAGWQLNRVVWAVDRGMTSEANLRELQRGGGHYIAGERMRAGKPTVEDALSRPGRYQRVNDDLEVKEVIVGEGAGRRRYVVVRNQAQAARDRGERELAVRRVEQELAALPGSGEEHTKAVCGLVAHPGLGRYIKLDRQGKPRLDRAKVKAEERLDGKYLVITSDESLSSADVALGYKQLAEVERAWRTLKTDLDIRPMNHRKTDRIRAHVLICWLALLLVRVVEVRCGETWPRVRQEMDRLQRGVFEGPNGRFVLSTDLTARQRQFLAAADVTPPTRFEALEPVRTASASPRR